MQPLTLMMSAFGPFAEQEVIDFSRLGDKPLFLINGPTGSGKTTLLDAICFALFGKTTGDEREGGQMRSDLAKADHLTEVVFSFALHDRRYRVRRVPEQMRPKARGEGETQHAAEAQLWEIDENDQPKEVIVSSKVTEATHEIESLLGLNADQFRQVMVLPQGKFRQLLMADSKDREKIFSQLFQTHIYKRLEDELKERSATIRREVETISKQRRAYLESVQLATEAELGAVFAVATEETEHLKHAYTQQQILANQSEQNLSNAHLLIRQFIQQEKLEEEQQQLTAQRDAISADAERLKRLDQAADIQPHYQQVEHHEAQLQQRVNQLSQQRELHLLQVPQLEQATAKLAGIPAMQGNLAQLKEQAVHLRSHQQQIATLTAERALLVQSEEKRLQQKNHTDQLQQLAHQAKERFTSLDSELNVLRLDIDKQSDLGSKSERLKALCDIKRRVVKSEQHLETQQRALKQSLEQGKQLAAVAETAKRDADSIARDWHLAQASILAAQLEEGIACPVCGSEEHPAPALALGQTVSQADVEAARATAQQAASQLQTERDNYRFINKEIERISQEIKDDTSQLQEFSDLTLEALIELHRNSVADLKLLEDQRNKLKHLEQQYQLVKANVTSQEQAYETARKNLELASNEAEGLTHSVRKLAESIPEELRENNALQAAINANTLATQTQEREIESIQSTHQQAKAKAEEVATKIALLQEQIDDATKQLNTAKITWESTLNSSQFTSLASFKEECLRLSERDSIRARINLHQQNWAACQGAINSLATELEGKVKPDIPHLESEVTAHKNILDQKQHAWQVKHDHFISLRNAKQQLDSLKATSAALDEKYAVVGTLSDIANGQNDSKVSLQRFVLSVLLDDVLMDASQRLLAMSKGRYRLLRKEDRSKGNRASGLDLEVEDAYTGRVRAVATLSGGESFMAALALALGLSDVVQAYAGGIRLDTLFIDEGFGSLDPESLDLAIRTLIDLQQTGRMIGIISHVSELKEQIPLRIDIAASEVGSKIVWRT